jgi:hypothetical protein
MTVLLAVSKGAVPDGVAEETIEDASSLLP